MTIEAVHEMRICPFFRLVGSLRSRVILLSTSLMRSVARVTEHLLQARDVFRLKHQVRYGGAALDQ